MRLILFTPFILLISACSSAPKPAGQVNPLADWYVELCLTAFSELAAM